MTGGFWISSKEDSDMCSYAYEVSISAYYFGPVDIFNIVFATFFFLCWYTSRVTFINLDLELVESLQLKKVPAKV